MRVISTYDWLDMGSTVHRGADSAEFGRITSTQRYSIHDGPGIRTTLFLKGCPLACFWCHNPESIEFEPSIWLFPERCIRCDDCRKVCPHPLPAPDDIAPPIDHAHCQRCGACVEVCLAEARQWVGRSISVDEAMAELLRDIPFFEQSGGGVTFSGGEPLSQPRFLTACLRACKQAGVHTIVDTCGFAPQNRLLNISQWTDLFLYDLKTVDNTAHLQATGVSVRPILDNLLALDSAESDIWLRVPLVPGFNDAAPALDAIGSFVARLKRTRRLHLLPYHNFGFDKYRRINRSVPELDPTPFSAEQLSEAAQRLSHFGLDVRIGG